MIDAFVLCFGWINAHQKLLDEDILVLFTEMCLDMVVPSLLILLLLSEEVLFYLAKSVNEENKISLVAGSS